MNTKGSVRMKFTGERYIPGIKGDIELEHRHRYLRARELCRDKDVLDLASGEGYGSAILSSVANSVVGVDIAEDAVRYSQRTYVRPNLRFIVGSCTEIELPNASIDVVVSFETLEHHDQHDEMMVEVKRILRASGLLLISTPDRYHYSGGHGHDNEFHVKELYRDEFAALLRRYFTNVSLYGQRTVFGDLIVGSGLNVKLAKLRQTGEAVAWAEEIIDPIFRIALASDAPLPTFASSFLEQASEDSDIAALKASTSWRITAPLRAASRLARRLYDSRFGYRIALASRVMMASLRAPLRGWRSERVIAGSRLSDSTRLGDSDRADIT